MVRWMRHLAAVALLAVAAPASARDTLVYAGHVFDAASARMLPAQTIRIRDGRIVAMQPGRVTDVEAEVIDLSTATGLPGLIDAHVHITRDDEVVSDFRAKMETSLLDSAFLGVGAARRTLLAGFTTVRDVGAREGVGIALKRAVERGRVPGPRIVTSDLPVGPTGGHSDASVGLDPGLHRDDWGAALVDGPEEARKAVRDRWRQGADLIKMMASETGGRPGVRRFDADEMAAIVRTAHKLDMKVAAHNGGDTASVRAAIEAGVDSIEHAIFEGTARERQGIYAAMRAHGTVLVPTIHIQERLLELARQDRAPDRIAYWTDVVARARRNTLEAYRAGVRIALGTDATGLIPHGQDAIELRSLVDAGLSPAEALRAATATGDLIGAPVQVGRIAPGYRADIVAVQGDPTDDIDLMARPSFVMKDGIVVKRDR